MAPFFSFSLCFDIFELIYLFVVAMQVRGCHNAIEVYSLLGKNCFSWKSGWSDGHDLTVFS